MFIYNEYSFAHVGYAQCIGTGSLPIMQYAATSK